MSAERGEAGVNEQGVMVVRGCLMCFVLCVCVCVHDDEMGVECLNNNQLQLLRHSLHEFSLGLWPSAFYTRTYWHTDYSIVARGREKRCKARATINV